MFTNFEKALRGNDFKDPEKGYAAYIDVDSFVNFFIVQELSKNIDGNCRKSSYMTKEKGRKLRFCHVWDYDMAFGVANFFPSNEGQGGNGPTGWWVKCYGPGNNYKGGWYYRMFQDPAFVRKVRKRWNELYPELSRVPEYMDYEIARMGSSAIERNFDKWRILGSRTYEEHVKFLKDFYVTRLEWMNKEISSW
ncbi:MAG: CotH kinase family protein [Bacteroidales bacterium]|nr:CotH kinase family protein [Bacteroidales bacterium]